MLSDLDDDGYFVVQKETWKEKSLRNLVEGYKKTNEQEEPVRESCMYLVQTVWKQNKSLKEPSKAPLSSIKRLAHWCR